MAWGLTLSQYTCIIIMLNVYLHQIHRNSWSNGLEVIVLRVQNISPNVVLPYILTFMWESTQDGGQWQNKNKNHLHNLHEIIGQKYSQTAEFCWSMKIFSECPKSLGRYQNYFQFIRCLQLWSITRFPKCQKNSSTGIFQMPNYLG